MNPSFDILVVEDDPTLRMLYGRALRRAGYHAHFHARGDDGLQFALAHPLALIILDWHLPGLNGFQILTALRSAGLRTPVMLLSGSGAHARADAFQAGADAFLDKPCGLEELLAMVGRLIGPSTRSAAA